METPIKMDDLGGTPIFGNTHMEKTNNFQLHQKNNVFFLDVQSSTPFVCWLLDSSSRRVMSDQVVEVVDMDPDIDEFNEDVEIPKDLDCPVLRRRACVWGSGESGELVFLLYS